jgi:hypothetical protein
MPHRTMPGEEVVTTVAGRPCRRALRSIELGLRRLKRFDADERFVDLLLGPDNYGLRDELRRFVQSVELWKQRISLK